jgi:hypothetical protein
MSSQALTSCASWRPLIDVRLGAAAVAAEDDGDDVLGVDAGQEAVEVVADIEVRRDVDVSRVG